MREKSFLLDAFFIFSSLNVLGSFAPSELEKCPATHPGSTLGAVFSCAASRLCSVQFRSSRFFLVTQAASVETPFLPGIRHEKNDEQQEQRQVVKFGAEIAPYWNTLSGLPPGGECEAQHMQRPKNRCWPHPESEQQTHSDKHFDHPDQVSEKNRMGQNQVGQNWLVKTYRAILDEALRYCWNPP